LRALSQAVSAGLSIERLRFVDRRVVLALRKLGVSSLWELVELALTARERRRLARAAGVSEGDVLKLVRIADMCRVAEPELAELLVEAGVHTPLELPLRPLEVVYRVVVETAARLRVTPPSREEVEAAQRRALELAPLFDY
jgi:hypothetical protein